MLPPNDGSIVPSSQQLLTTIERPRCSCCQARMMLERVSAGPIGFEHWLFECPKCDHVEARVIATDPFESKTAGWLAGELGRPN
jgi:Zn finger protein HypA/HybF involved in hydrogenase expression